MNFPFDLHLGYALMVVLGFALTMTFPLTRHFQDRLDKRRYYAMQAITAICALLGAKLAVLFGDALWPFEQRDQLEHAALAGAGAAGEEHEFTRLDVERNAGQRFTAIRVALRDVLENNHGGDSRGTLPCFRAGTP